jgi:hypothetical protein
MSVGGIEDRPMFERLGCHRRIEPIRSAIFYSPSKTC